MLRTTPLFLLFGTLTLFGCKAPYVMDSHADPATRMHNIADRLVKDRERGGMSGVVADIEACYANNTSPAIMAFGLRDCLVLDYGAYQVDVAAGPMFGGMRTPYFEDRVFAARVDHYAQLDGFTTPGQLAQYFRDTSPLVQADMLQLTSTPNRKR